MVVKKNYKKNSANAHNKFRLIDIDQSTMVIRSCRQAPVSKISGREEKTAIITNLKLIKSFRSDVLKLCGVHVLNQILFENNLEKNRER